MADEVDDSTPMSQKLGIDLPGAQPPAADPPKPDDPPATPKTPTVPEPKVKFVTPDDPKPKDPPTKDPEPGDKAQNFKALRESRDEALKQLQEIKSQHAALEANHTGISGEFEKYKAQFNEEAVKALQTQVSDYENKIRTLSINDAPEVVAATQSLTEKRQEVANTLKSLIPEVAASAEELMALPKQQRDQQLLEVMKTGEVDQATASKVWAELGQVDSASSAIETAKNQALASASDYQTRQEADLQARQAEADKQRDSALGDVLVAAAHPESGLAEFREIDGNDDHNTAVKERIQAVRDALTNPNLSFEDAATMAVLAEKGKASIKSDAAYQQTIAELTAKLQQYEKTMGTLVSATPSTTSTETPPTEPEVSFAQDIKNKMGDGWG